MYRQNQGAAGRPWGKIIGISLAVLFALGAGWLGASTLMGKSGDKPAATKTDTKQSPTPTPLPYKSVEGKYLISGTIVLDRVVVRAANGDKNQPFSQMKTFGTHDAGIADLECPVTDAPNQFMINVDNPRFNCRPDWLPAMKKYYQIVKLSGNHTYDKGAAGFKETTEQLAKAGIQAVGNYNPHDAPKNNCEIVALPVRLQKTGGGEEKGTLPMAFCAFNYKLIFSKPEPGEIELITKYSKMMPVFAFLQAGSEYITTAQPSTVSLARKFIDAGAEFVITNGAHMINNSEAYNGKLIVYSIGNFIFDQVNPEERRNVSISTSMSVDYDDNVAKWLEFGESCDITKRFDDCVDQAGTEGLEKFDLKLTYKPLPGVGGARAVTHLSTPAEQKSVLERLQWSETCKGLEGHVCAE